MFNKIDRPTYRAIERRVREEIERQKQEGQAFISLSPGLTLGLRRYNGKILSNKDIEQVWPKIVKAIGLIEDPYGGWTLPGKGITDEQVEEIKKKVGLIMSPTFPEKK